MWGPQRGDLRVALEGDMPGEALDEHSAERVHVRSAVERVATDLFGGDVVDRADQLTGRREPAHRERPLRQSEIGQVRVIGARLPSRFDEDVARLHVPVHEPGLMRRVQTSGELLHDRERPLHRERSLGSNQPREVGTLDVPHRDEQGSASLARLEHRNDVRVPERCRHPRLATESVAELLVLGELGREELQGHPATVPGRREIDHAHPPAADERVDPVAGDLGPDGRIAVGHRIPPPPDGVARPGPSRDERRDPPNWPDYPSSVADLAPGDRLGPYRLEQRLGEGGMGVVFRAVREPQGDEVALKILRPELSSDETFRKRFVHEARAAGEVRHKHLVSIVDAGEAEGRPYLAVAFVAGVTLEERLAEGGPMVIEDVVRVVAHVASGLDALHAAGIVHRDVKPSNVMIDPSGSANLTDFGLAKGRAYTVLTKPGMVMGTLDYLAPELLRGQPATAASDIYALGCLAYECTSGRAPFSDKSMFELASAHLNVEPPDPCANRPDAPAGTSFAILQALAKEPEKRPPTATAYATMLGFATGRANSSPASPPPPTPASSTHSTTPGLPAAPPPPSPPPP